MKIVRFKRWWQVTSDEGGTIEQFLTEEDAKRFIFVANNNAGLCETKMRVASRHRGYTVRRINIYP